MNVCHKHNTPEFKALMQVYNNEDIVQIVINLYNDTTDNTEIVIPTTLQVADLLLKQKKDFNAKKKSFSEKIMLNLQSLGYVTKVKGEWIIKKNLDNLGGNTTNDSTVQNAIRSYLDLLGFPTSIVSFSASDTLTKVIVNPGPLTLDQIATKETSRRTTSIINHLAAVFPQIKIKQISPTEAEKIYNDAADLAKLNVNFNNVKSFYAKGTAYLINGKFDNNTAIEEVMHPFIDALYVDNSDLFNGLLEDAKKSYPKSKRST